MDPETAGWWEEGHLPGVARTLHVSSRSHRYFALGPNPQATGSTDGCLKVRKTQPPTRHRPRRRPNGTCVTLSMESYQSTAIQIILETSQETGEKASFDPWRKAEAGFRCIFWKRTGDPNCPTIHLMVKHTLWTDYAF